MLMIERQNSTLWTSWGIGTALWTEKEATEVKWHKLVPIFMFPVHERRSYKQTTISPKNKQLSA
jgi:hypothetical protein